MKRLFTGALAFGALLMMAACSSTGGFAPISIASVQQAAANACGFLPTAETVTGILAAGVPGLGTAEAVANAICAAVAPKSGTPRATAAPPTIGGVTLKGVFITGSRSG